MDKLFGEKQNFYTFCIYILPLPWYNYSEVLYPRRLYVLNNQESHLRRPHPGL